MADESERLLYEDAVKSYLLYQSGGTTAPRLPDPTKSVVTAGPDRTVILRDSDGAPLGTVTWFGESDATFEPPTKITLVDLFQGLRPKEP